MFTVCSCKLLVSEGERQGEDWLGQESTVCSCKLLVSEGERPAGAWLTAEFTEFAEWTESLRGMPPPVFSQKRPQTIENKGRGHEKERQESSRAGKRKEVKEIEEATGLPTQPGRGRRLCRGHGAGLDESRDRKGAADGDDGR